MSLKIDTEQSGNHQGLAEILRAAALWLENNSQNVYIQLNIQWKERSK
jgi:hypothetical protein